MLRPHLLSIYYYQPTSHLSTHQYTLHFIIFYHYHILLHVQVHEVPFNSSNKWQMSIHHMKYNDQQLLLLKVCDPITEYLSLPV